MFADWPIAKPRNWPEFVNRVQTETGLAAVRQSVNRNTPFGNEPWVKNTSTRLGLEFSLRPRGRPRAERCHAEMRLVKRGASLFSSMLGPKCPNCCSRATPPTRLAFRTTRETSSGRAARQWRRRPSGRSSRRLPSYEPTLGWIAPANDRDDHAATTGPTTPLEPTAAVVHPIVQVSRRHRLQATRASRMVAGSTSCPWPIQGALPCNVLSCVSCCG